MRNFSKLALLAAATILTPPALAAELPQGAPVSALVKDVSIPYSTFTLKNGLKVVVHEDHKAPVVAVSVWYHVGSKDEPAGSTGFAHLFEHLMFGGSEHSDTSWFQPMQAIGATDLNGTTNFDRTNYFETVPKAALDRALFLESDRMGTCFRRSPRRSSISSAASSRTRSAATTTSPAGCFNIRSSRPCSRPAIAYHHTVIGSMSDLDKASLEVVKDWFRSHYGPNNAVLVLAGDITPAEAQHAGREIFRRHSRGAQVDSGRGAGADAEGAGHQDLPRRGREHHDLPDVGGPGNHGEGHQRARDGRQRPRRPRQLAARQ